LVAGTIASAAGVWTTNAPAPTRRDELGGAAAPCPGGTIALGCVYLEAGGSDGPGNANEIYSTFTNTWTTGMPVPTARNLLGVAAAHCALGQTGTCIYAVDGYNSGTLNTNEAYQPNSNTWTTLAADPVAREDVGAAPAPCPGGTIAGGCVYVEDGLNNTGNLNTNEAYSTFTNTWITLTPDQVARRGPFVASGRCPVGQTGICIYVIGGYNGSYLNTAESFNPKTNSWTTLSNMLTARYEGGAAGAPCPGGTVVGGCIYTVDGFGGMNTVEAYNTWNNTWLTETADPFSGGRGQLAAVAARCFGKSGICVYATDGDNITTSNVNEALTP
jgi:hypothetical protein